MTTTRNKPKKKARPAGTADARGFSSRSSRDPKSLIKKINDGLSFDELQDISTHLAVPVSELAATIDLPPRTLARRKRDQKLSPGESDRLAQISLVFGRAVELFEGQLEAAQRWFRAPNRALGGKSPLEYCNTAVGAREVEHLIGRLEHGVIA